MNQSATGRMLLSHNFDLSEAILPKLSREEFAIVFNNGFQERADIRCRLLANPHWIVEILFPANALSPSDLGELCAQILVQKRLRQKAEDITMPDILILGGIKTTPATSNSPDSLQTGEWGVDVVETASAKQFLQSINWEATTSQRDPHSIFKIELKG